MSLNRAILSLLSMHDVDESVIIVFVGDEFMLPEFAAANKFAKYFAKNCKDNILR